MLNQEAMVPGLLSPSLTQIFAAAEEGNPKYQLGIDQSLSLLSMFVNFNQNWAH